ncbi:MAG: BLUF domain-containing protein [Casimicrobium sp.]
MIYRLVYVSTALDSVDLNEFKKILNTAQTNNGARDLTGMLAFNSKVFLQALEGSREAINDLYAKLVRDPRHFNLMLLKYASIEQRHWSAWSMGFAAPNADNRALFLKYSNQSVFNPYGMTGDNAEQLLIELSSTTMSLDAKNSENANSGTKPAQEKSIFARFLR